MRSGALWLQYRRVSNSSGDPLARVIWTVASRRKANEVEERRVVVGVVGDDERAGSTGDTNE